jgi:hypothetical protein
MAVSYDMAKALVAGSGFFYVGGCFAIRVPVNAGPYAMTGTRMLPLQGERNGRKVNGEESQTSQKQWE